jgi:hypothetical protein
VRFCTREGGETLLSPSSPLPLRLVQPSLTPSPLPFLLFPSLFFPLSSGLVVQPPRVHSALPSRSPLAIFHPLPSRRSRFYDGAQFRFFPSPICRPSFLHSSDAPHQGLPHRPSYPSMPSPPRSCHHASARGSHAPTACISRAAVSASSWCQKLSRQPPSALSSTDAQWAFLLLFFFISYVLLFSYIFICVLWAIISLPCCGLILRRRLLVVAVLRLPFGSL